MRVIYIVGLIIGCNLGLAADRTILSCKTIDIETPMDFVQSGNTLQLSLRGLEKGDSTSGDMLINFFGINPSTRDWWGPYDVTFSFPNVCQFPTSASGPPTFSCGASPNLTVKFVAELDSNVLSQEESLLLSADMSVREEGTYALTINLSNPNNPQNKLSIGGDTDESLAYRPGACSW
jgi:hypothetical protein